MTTFISPTRPSSSATDIDRWTNRGQWLDSNILTPSRRVGRVEGSATLLYNASTTATPTTSTTSRSATPYHLTHRDELVVQSFDWRHTPHQSQPSQHHPHKLVATDRIPYSYEQAVAEAMRQAEYIAAQNKRRAREASNRPSYQPFDTSNDISSPISLTEDLSILNNNGASSSGASNKPLFRGRRYFDMHYERDLRRGRLQQHRMPHVVSSPFERGRHAHRESFLSRQPLLRHYQRQQRHAALRKIQSKQQPTASRAMPAPAKQQHHNQSPDTSHFVPLLNVTPIVPQRRQSALSTSHSIHDLSANGSNDLSSSTNAASLLTAFTSSSADSPLASSSAGDSSLQTVSTPFLSDITQSVPRHPHASKLLPSRSPYVPSSHGKVTQVAVLSPLHSLLSLSETSTSSNNLTQYSSVSTGVNVGA